MRKLLIATSNTHKTPSIVAELKGLPFEIIGPNDIKDLPSDHEVSESAMTFEGNAIIKAMAYGHKTGLFTLADDSGICVDALNGRPGVLSARYVPGNLFIGSVKF